MKKTIIAAALVMFAGSAFAEQNTVLQVQGKLTAASCTPELSNGGIVDYGYIHLSSLSADKINQIGQKQIDLNINCTVATKVSWSLLDDKASTRAGINVENATSIGQTITPASASQIFGIGLAGDVKIGNYATFIDISKATADTKSVDIIYKQLEQPWVKSTNGSTQGDNYRNMTVATSGTLEPLAFTNATFPLVTSLAIQSTTQLAITDDTPLEGQLTISLHYL